MNQKRWKSGNVSWVGFVEYKRKNNQTRIETIATVFCSSEKYARGLLRVPPSQPLWVHSDLVQILTACVQWRAFRNGERKYLAAASAAIPIISAVLQSAILPIHFHPSLSSPPPLLRNASLLSPCCQQSSHWLWLPYLSLSPTSIATCLMEHLKLSLLVQYGDNWCCPSTGSFSLRCSCCNVGST